MEVRCAICGNKTMISEVHQDYEKFLRMELKAIVFFCERCNQKLRKEAQDCSKPKKPV